MDDKKKSSSFSALVKEPKIMVPILFLAVLAGTMLFTYFQKKEKIANPSEKFFEYYNEDFEFRLKLPGSFEYFQTQRKKSEGYTDIEIMVPTADRLYAQEVAGYGKPLTVRVYEKAAWEALSDDKKDKSFEYQGIKNDLVYLLRFWENIPDDWEEKWAQGAEKYIKDNFKLE